MTKDKVLKKIKKKFGTYSKFARMAGLDDYEFRLTFVRKGADVSEAKIIEMDQICDNVPFIWNNILTKKDVVALRDALAEYGGVRKFVNDQKKADPNCGYSEDPIFKILAAKRTTITPTAKKLMAYFNIVR